MAVEKKPQPEPIGPVVLRNMENTPLVIDYNVAGQSKTLRFPTAETGRDKATVRLDAADAEAVLAHRTVQGWLKTGRLERYAA